MEGSPKPCYPGRIWNLLVGASWEGYVIEQIRQLKNSVHDIYYYRTQNGAESDLVLVGGLKPMACIEIKYSNSPVVSKGFFNCIQDLNTQKNYIITPNSEFYPLKEGVFVTSLVYFLSNILKNLD